MTQEFNQPDVSIMLTSWNVRDLLRECLCSVHEKTKGITYEIIVVDDGSTDGTREMIEKEFPEVKLLVNETNLGFARANNRGLGAATGRYILLLNSDTVLLNNAIKILVDFLDAEPDAGVCAGWLKNRDLTSQVSYGSFPSFHQALLDALFLNDLFPQLRLPNRGVLPRGSMPEPFEVDYVTGADALIRREPIDELGLFDERFEAYCEETDFCYRVKNKAGKKIFFVPEAEIVHLGGMSYGSFPRHQIQLMYSSYHKFLSKHHGAVYSLATRALYAWHYFIKMSVRLLRYLFTRSGKKEERKKSLLHAWYSVLYSLFPDEQAL